MVCDEIPECSGSPDEGNRRGVSDEKRFGCCNIFPVTRFRHDSRGRTEEMPAKQSIVRLNLQAITAGGAVESVPVRRSSAHWLRVREADRAPSLELRRWFDPLPVGC